MKSLLIASRVHWFVGVLLLVVAAIHLAVTSLLTDTLLDGLTNTEARSFIEPPFLLNHIVVGLLLIPLGLVTLYSSSGLRARQRWAWVIGWIIATGLMSLPVALVSIMRGGQFDAVPFKVAAVLVTVCATAMPISLWCTRHAFRVARAASGDASRAP